MAETSDDRIDSTRGSGIDIEMHHSGTHHKKTLYESQNENIDKKFSDIFEQKLSESEDAIQMVTNLKFINILLIGMTEMLHRRFKTSQRQKE